MAGVYTVTQINSYIKNMFQQDFVLKSVQVKGEISNCKYHSSGHIYFTLKDETGAIACIMFASNAKSLKFTLKDGLAVNVHGRVDVYERDGKYQLYVTSIEEDGIGDLNKKFLELKKYYEEMGYFDPMYKRPIPSFAKRIGVVTARTGAAIRDIINISKRRNPYIDIILYPALVQGENAKYSIVKGIKTLNKLDLDCIIIGRGGGSIEDLWAFNEAEVIEAIIASKIPIISAVGHEIDFTLSDFAADLRAPTPSAAAELAVSDITVIENTIDNLKRRLDLSMSRKIASYRDLISKYELRLKFLDPINVANKNREDLIRLEEQLEDAFSNILQNKKNKLELLITRLEGASPLKKLSSGYSYVEHNGKNVSSIKDVNTGDSLNIYLKDGKLEAIVGGKSGKED
ncbi:exodeoxyribonuclease VII large subunit [Lachnospira pectinoschiza]|uniref:Exodeoxyribonuclease 7 large subunit n=1 Tax=Lachnospira pectinoschiza TaxID=28052 RepID=A0A1G9VMZ4_9FIRM|nr:exodeoxyribonuclease VII large subunit [Lachnospira pectinoschiza]SDM73612.1 Exodeoxyribonuclease VII large subunit [Lachnospira pectinoschiza]